MNHSDSSPFTTTHQGDSKAGGAPTGSRVDYLGTAIGADHGYQGGYVSPQSNSTPSGTEQRSGITSFPCQFLPGVLDKCHGSRFYARALEYYLLEPKVLTDEDVLCPMLDCRQSFLGAKHMLQHLKVCNSLDRGSFICPCCKEVETYRKTSKKKCSWSRATFGAKVQRHLNALIRSLTSKPSQCPHCRRPLQDVSSQQITLYDEEIIYDPNDLKGLTPSNIEPMDAGSFPFQQENTASGDAFEMYGSSGLNELEHPMNTPLDAVVPGYQPDSTMYNDAPSSILFEVYGNDPPTELMDTSSSSEQTGTSPTSYGRQSTASSDVLVPVSKPLSNISSPSTAHGGFSADVSPDDAENMIEYMTCGPVLRRSDFVEQIDGFGGTPLGYNGQRLPVTNPFDIPNDINYIGFTPNVSRAAPVDTRAVCPSRIDGVSTLGPLSRRDSIALTVQTNFRGRFSDSFTSAPSINYNGVNEYVSSDQCISSLTSQSVPFTSDLCSLAQTSQQTHIASASSGPSGSSSVESTTQNEQEFLDDDLNCPSCDYRPKGKVENLRAYLAKHVKNHQGKMHSCEKCGGVFTRRDNMTQHIKRVHSELIPSRKRPTSSGSLFQRKRSSRLP